MVTKHRPPSTYSKQGRAVGGLFGTIYDYGEPLSKQPVGSRLPESVAAKIKALPNASQWIRDVLVAAAATLDGDSPATTDATTTDTGISEPAGTISGATQNMIKKYGDSIPLASMPSPKNQKRQRQQREAELIAAGYKQTETHWVR